MPVTIKRPRLLYQVVKDSIFRKLVSPLLREGGQLPSDRKLAAEYGVNVGTVNKALHELARDGFLERRVGAGTFVVPRARAGKAVGIYFGGPILDGLRENVVYGELDRELQEMIGATERSFRHFVDLRIPKFQGETLPELADDVAASKIGSLIVARASYSEYEWLTDLPVPVVGNGVDCCWASVNYDLRAAGREAAGYLAARGCRRIAMIHPLGRGEAPSGGREAALWEGIQEALQEGGLAGRAVWAEHDASAGARPDDRGYAAFRNLWSLRPRPDGLVIFTDIHALGAMRAAKELGVVAGKDVRIVACANEEHRWPELDGLPQMLLSIKEVARALLELAQKLERGDSAGDVTVPYRFDPGATKAGA